MQTIFNAAQAAAADRADEVFSVAMPTSRGWPLGAAKIYSRAEAEAMVASALREVIEKSDMLQLAIFLQMQRALCAILDEVAPGATPISIDSHLPPTLITQIQAAVDASFGAVAKVAA